MMDEARIEFDALAEDDFKGIPADANWIGSFSLAADACANLGDAKRAGTLYKILKPYDGLTVVAGRAAACYGRSPATWAGWPRPWAGSTTLWPTTRQRWSWLCAWGIVRPRPSAATIWRRFCWLAIGTATASGRSSYSAIRLTPPRRWG